MCTGRPTPHPKASALLLNTPRPRPPNGQGCPWGKFTSCRSPAPFPLSAPGGIRISPQPPLDPSPTEHTSHEGLHRLTLTRFPK